MPVKTGLAAFTFIGLFLLPEFVPALEKYKALDPRAAYYLVVDLPIKGPPSENDPGPKNEELKAARLEATAPRNLIDPTHELDHFYDSLLKGGTTRILHYGDSPTTGDLITADARAALQKQFGDAGSGFALMARPWAWYNHRGVEMEGSGWGIDVAGATEVKDGMHGLGGASFRGSAGATARFALKNAHNAVEIAYLSQPDGGDFTVEADGSNLGTVETAADSKAPGFSAFNVPDGAKKFTIRVTRGSVRLYGADFRRSSPGVVYHSLGVNGANVTLLSRSFSGPHWTAELRHYKPDLVIINYGTNESGYPTFVEGTWGQELKNAVKRVQAALPDTSVLLMSPMDRGERKHDGKIDTITAMPNLVKIEAGVGQETGVAFFNTFQAMGGPGTMGRWYASEPRLVGADFIHPMPAGAKIVGELLYSALRDGYNDYKLRQLNKASVQTASKVMISLARAGCILSVAVGVCLGANTSTPAKSTAPSTKSKNKRYRSSVGKPSPKTAAKKAPVRTAAKKVVSSASKSSTTVRRKVSPPRISAATRIEANQGVFQKVSTGATIPVENAGSLIPFFEQLYRHQKGDIPGPLRILHYGDSHTAADEWTGDIRNRFQEKFGDGGSGYSLIGRPYAGYRRFDVRSGSTRGWHTEGLVGKTPGDGIYGLGGISMSTRLPRESVYLLADGQQFELFYLQQPGGGAIQIYDNGTPVERISTDGTPAPGYYHYEGVPGTHKFEVETLDRAPVRLFGWVAENSRGVTYEELGINGAQASTPLNWDEVTMRSNIERRNPALIVLAYGTNEAGRKDWTVESYRDMFVQMIGRFRTAAPTATILLIGPPDRYIRTRSKGWIPMENIDLIVDAQRQAASATGCAFWDLRAKMGGKGAMREWVLAGMAQNDYVHFTSPGYRMIGDAVFRDLMGQYDLFLKARENVANAAASDNAQAQDRH